MKRHIQKITVSLLINIQSISELEKMNKSKFNFKSQNFLNSWILN